MKTRLIAVLSIVAVFVMVAGVLAVGGVIPSPGQAKPETKMEVMKALYADTSRPLTQMAADTPSAAGVPANDLAKARRLPGGGLEIIDEGAEVEVEIPNMTGPPSAPELNIASSPASPDSDFDGVSADEMAEAAFNGLLVVAPPDPTGEAGSTQYFQWVNVAFAVYDKATGTRLLGPVAGNALWQGMAGTPPSPGAPTPVCATENHGDPIVTWDQLASRWVISQFAFAGAAGVPPYYQCIAVSTTADATGAWHRYVFPVHPVLFHDYPKVSVWPDAYYMSANQFAITPAGVGLVAGVGAWAFDRTKMLTGDPTAALVYFNVSQPTNTGAVSALPSDIEGVKQVSGRPNFFLMADDAANSLRLWEFKVNWANPILSTFGVASAPGLGGTPNQILPVTPFSSLCGNNRNCAPELGGEGLDALSPRLMWRLIYRVFGGYEYMAVNHTVNVGGVNGIRWYILRRGLPRASKAGEVNWSVWQQGDYGGDGIHRWMGSAAMDKFGNLGVGYSASNVSMFPEIRYNGRQFADPLNTFGATEQTMHAGIGSQIGTQNRWGDYTHLSIDPVDDCTFWYTNQYYGSPDDFLPAIPPLLMREPDTTPTDSFDWRTRIGSFRFPNCPAPVAT